MSITTLIVDDHARFRVSARALLEMDGFDVVGEAVNGATARVAAESICPDLVLLDVQLPDVWGYDLAREILAQGWAKYVVLVSSRDESDYGDSISASGATGFLPKGELSGAGILALLEKERTCR